MELSKEYKFEVNKHVYGVVLLLIYSQNSPPTNCWPIDSTSIRELLFKGIKIRSYLILNYSKGAKEICLLKCIWEIDTPILKKIIISTHLWWHLSLKQELVLATRSFVY